MTKASALQGEFPLMVLLIPSLVTNAGDQQFMHVALHKNACFSERAVVT